MRGRGSARRRLQAVANLLPDTLGVMHHLLIPEPDHTKPLSLQPICPSFILHGPLGMLPAVQFDDQPGGQTTEVDDEGTSGLLAPEFMT